MSSLKNLSFGKEDRFNHDDIGWNYIMTKLQASLGLSQLKRIDKIVTLRHKVGLRYYNNLKNNKNIFIPPPKNHYSKNIYWVIAILIKNKKLKLNAKKVISILNKQGIGARPFFWPMHKQKVLNKLKLIKSKNFPNSEYISKYGLYIPSSLSLKNSEIDYISNKINSILN